MVKRLYERPRIRPNHSALLRPQGTTAREAASVEPLRGSAGAPGRSTPPREAAAIRQRPGQHDATQIRRTTGSP
jgi:hypothetical protein